MPIVQVAKNTAFRYRYVVLAVVTFCYTIQYLDRVQINTLMPFISKDLKMSEVQIGLGSTLMLLFYGPSQWFTGWLCDRIGSRRIMIFSVIAWSLMTAWMGFMQSVQEWYFRMAIFGVLIGTEINPSARLLVRWFPPQQRARAASVLSWAWIITPAWAPLASTALYVAIGERWREAFWLVAAAGVLPLILILFFIVDRPEHCKHANREEVEECYAEELRSGLLTAQDFAGLNREGVERSVKSGNITFRKILTTKGYLPMVLAVVFVQQVFWGMMVWGAQYLSQVHHFSVKTMGAWACVYFAGGAFGSFLSSWISDRLLGGRRKPMIFVCFACAIPFIVTLANIQAGVPSWLLLLTLTGAGFFSNMAWGPLMAMPAELFSAEVYGKANGFAGCISYMCAAACPYIMGMLIQTNETLHTKDYHWAWMYIAGTAVAGIVATCFLVDKKPRSPMPEAMAVPEEPALA